VPAINKTLQHQNASEKEIELSTSGPKEIIYANSLGLENDTKKMFY
jgi:hypothetical protein